MTTTSGDPFWLWLSLGLVVLGLLVAAAAVLWFARRTGQPRLLYAVAAGVVLFAALLAALIVGLEGVTAPPRDAANAFMAALRDAEYERAYDLGSPELRREAQSAAGIQRVVEVGGVRPRQWSFSSTTVEGDAGLLEGSVTFQSGRAGAAVVEVARLDGVWKVTGFELNER